MPGAGAGAGAVRAGCASRGDNARAGRWPVRVVETGQRWALEPLVMSIARLQVAVVAHSS